MELKISNNLFLGKVELEHLIEGLKSSGYEKVFNQMITSYGVIRAEENGLWTTLQPISSGLGLVTIKAGIAIDDQLDVIEVDTDQNNVLSIPADSVTRYIYIHHTDKIDEEGTINIAVDGVVTGTGTKFTERLRGQGNFPSKIRLIQQTGGPEILTEYEVQAIQSDTLMSLNVAAGVMDASTDRTYRIVGSFTPGIVPPSGDKFPLISDGWTITTAVDIIAPNGQQFILGSVVNNGVVQTITDMRNQNQFSIHPPNETKITDFNHVAGFEWSKYDSVISDGSKNLVKVGWGIQSLNGNWSMDVAQSKLAVQQGTGGIWKNITDVSVLPDGSDGSYAGWYVVYENTGLAIKVISSTYVGVELQLTMDYNEAYPIQGNIMLVPDGDLFEMRITNSTNPTTDREVSYAMKQGFAMMPIEAGSTSSIQYRHIKGELVTQFRLLNDGTYFGEGYFDANGVSNGLDSETASSSGGLIIPNPKIGINISHLDKVMSPGFILDFYGTLSQAQAVIGYVMCDGATINSPGSIFHGLTSPDLRGRATVGVDLSDPDYTDAGNIGGSNTITLEQDQLPAHSHEVRDSGHTHSTKNRLGSNLTDSNVPAGGEGNDDTIQLLDSLSPNSETGSSETGIILETTGGGADIDIRQKYFVLHKLMKL